MVDGLLDRLKALADPLRLRIVGVLLQQELAVTELAEVLQISQPRVSHHLKALKDAGLISVRREGSWTFCSMVCDDGAAGRLLSALEPQAGGFAPEPEDLGRLGQVIAQRRQRSKAYFESVAGAWSQYQARFAGNGLRHQAMSYLLPEDLVVADIGCGNGFMAQALSTRARRVILIDHSPAMLDQARVQLGEVRDVDLDFRVGEMDHLPLADGEVDAAFANLVLHHVPDLEMTLREMRRIIRPEGQLIISDLMPHNLESLREEEADLRLGLRPEELSARLERAGFECVRHEHGTDALRVTTREGEESLLPLFVMCACRRR